MLLELSPTGWGPHWKPTPRRTELFADWIEAQALLAGVGASVSQPDLIDRLNDAGLVKDSDDAWVLVADAIKACKRRREQIGAGYPFSLAGKDIELSSCSATPYSLCLLSSLPEQIKPLRTDFPPDFRDIFEQVVVEALRTALPGWSIYATGWASIAAAEGKGAIVQRVASWAKAKTVDESVFPHANDAQVDIAAVRPFADDRSAFPVILGQCATGATDWKQKAIRPNLERWGKAVQFSSNPTKLFAVPFSLDEKSFWEATVESSGIVLDRCRLCHHIPTASTDLQGKITTWLEKALTTLPLAA